MEKELMPKLPLLFFHQAFYRPSCYLFIYHLYKLNTLEISSLSHIKVFLCLQYSLPVIIYCCIHIFMIRGWH